MTTTASPLSLDDIIEAYESLQAGAGRADLASFLPPADHPQYLAVLRELVRVDLEYGWRKRQATRLDEYGVRFPALLQDRTGLAEVAFEEYRQRRQIGESVSPAEYGAKYGIDTTGWPSTPGTGTSPPTAPTRLMPADQELAAAAQAYLSFSLRSGSVPDQNVDAWAASVHSQREFASLFRDVHHESPQAARRLAQAVTAMPPVGTTFLGFRLLAVLGSGTFGRVYLAQQGDLADRLVALKVSAEVLGESQRLAQLQHTNIVPIYSLHHARPFQAVCMPYFGPTTLADVLRHLHGRKSMPQSGRELVNTLAACRSDTFTGSSLTVPLQGSDGEQLSSAASESTRGPAPELTASLGHSTVTLKMLGGCTYVQAILWLGARLADGLAHAHERGILHRDLKPANILLTDEGQPMLLDFNLAADTKLATTASAAMIGGTLPFMAPEHLNALRGGTVPVDARSDVYALGVILFELLTGQHPFPLRRETLRRVLGPMIEDRQGPPPALRSWNKNITPAVEAIVQRCLATDPAQRYQSARDLQEDLQRQLDNLPLKHARERSLRERARKWMKRHPRLASTGSLAVFAAVLIVSLGGSYLGLRSHNAWHDAMEEKSHFSDEMNNANLLILNVLRPDQEQLDLGMAECRSALGRYGVLTNDAWRDRPAFRNLPPQEQAGVSEELGKGLMLLAAATLLHSSNHPERTGREEQARTALKWNQRAETCFLEGRVPSALWLQRAQCLRLLGHPIQESERLEAQARNSPPGTPEQLKLLARDLVIGGRFQDALPLLSEAGRLQPHDFMVWYTLGICHDAVGQDEAAAACYTTCIALMPKLFSPYEKRGQAYLRMQRYDQALLDVEKVMELQPKRAEVYMDRALARQALKDNQGAIDDLGRALELDGPAARIYLMRARIRELAGDKAGAAVDRDAGLRAEPTDAQSWLDRGITRLNNGDPQAALADFGKALELNPRSLEALQNQASILSERLGRTAEAIQTLNRLVLLYPDYVPARAGRGVLLARQGRRDEALADAEACLLRDTKPPTLYQVAGIYALTSRQEFNDRFQALQLLSSALQRGYGRELVPIDTDLDPIRNLPEFQAIVNKAPCK